MIRALAFMLVGLAAILLIHHAGEPRRPLLVQTGATPCVKLPNPCSVVNCNKPDTRRIA